MGGTRAAKNATRAAKKAKPGAPADNKTTRAPRISVGFHNLRFVVCPEKIQSAKKALLAAFAENADWEPEAWKNRAEVVLQPFREGIQWGGQQRFQGPRRDVGVAVAERQPQAGRRPGAEDALPAAMVSTRVASLPLAPARDEDGRGRNTAADGASSPRAQKAADGANESDGANGSVSGCIGRIADGAKAAELFAQQMTAIRDRHRLQPPFHMIARGGFGRVYRCDAWRNDVACPKQVVAVKVVHKYEGGLQDAAIARNEIENLMVVNGHRRIVKLLSWMETTIDVQMVFPFYQEDVSLAIERGLFRLQRGRDDRVALACGQLLDAISFVHSKSIVHRDIKPSNMFVAAVGAEATQDFTVVLGDFGSSTKRTVGITQPPTRSSPPTTWHYLAPELFLPGAVCDLSSDMGIGGEHCADGLVACAIWATSSSWANGAHPHLSGSSAVAHNLDLG